MEIKTLEEANKAVLENNLAIQIQPPAPKPTEHYYVTDGWRKHIYGHKYSKSVDVETVRNKIKRAIESNRFGTVKAVEMEMVE